jgi:prepilin signal peptidase PulO-like enzyme (type II secretory pathway)
MLLQLLVVSLLAACLAGQLNRGIYRLGSQKRAISPWSSALAGLPKRGWRDRLPVIGWWWLRRESAVHGTEFWLRPALIELSLIVGLPALYAFELQGGLLPIGALPLDAAVLRAQFVTHACLIALMIVATFIDLDEKTIPDEITVPGTLLAVILAGCWPRASLPIWLPAPSPLQVAPLRLTTPGEWRAALDGNFGWWLATACIVGWWYALLPKTLWYRSGPVKFFRYLVVSVWRHRLSPGWTLLTLAAWGGTTVVHRLGGDAWAAVLSAWVGMAVGGITVWLVRIVASMALAEEAMGFGDVTLMGMIGAFLGWQPALLVFFLAPFTGVLVAVTQFLATRRKDIAFGPYLCLAALLVMVGWAEVWKTWGLPVFMLGALVPAVLLMSLGMLGGLLWVLRVVKRLFGAGR